jgi:hypothetical protein
MGEYPVDTIHDAPPFRGFQLDDGQRGALDIAGWLHDGGKVTARGAAARRMPPRNDGWKGLTSAGMPLAARMMAIAI